MKSYKGRFEPTRFEDLAVTVDFHCHSACRFCIVQEGLNYFRGVPFDTFRKAVDDNVRQRRYRRVVFTGGEVTLEPKLFDYVNYAAQAKCFDHIRLQTNARPLANMDFARRLVEAGVDEFFVSLHGPDAESQDYISQRAGSFDEAVAGLQNLRELGVCIITNTVLTTLNVDRLTDLVDFVSRFSPARMEFWNYLPMEDYADTRDLLAPMAKLGPALSNALGRAKQLGIPASVKYVPRCLLGEHGDRLDNSQPDVVIVEKFYDVYPEFNCIYEAQCEHSETCLGLHHPYISKFGWEERLLSPIPRTTPWREQEYGLAAPPDEPLRPHDTPRPTTVPSEWTALVDGVAESCGARLESTHLDRRRCIYHFAFPDGSSVDIVLTKCDPDQPALARTPSFNLHYRNVVGSNRDQFGKLIREAIRAIAERDKGDLMLDARKGLVGPDAFRRRPSGKTAGTSRKN